MEAQILLDAITSNGAMKMLVIKGIVLFWDRKKICNLEKDLKVLKKWVKLLIVYVFIFGIMNVILLSMILRIP